MTPTGWVDRADSNDTVALYKVEQYVVAAAYVVIDKILLPMVCRGGFVAPYGV